MKNIQLQINRFLIFINSKITKNMIAQYLLWNNMQNLHLKKIPIAHHINCITKIGLNKSKL